MCVCVRVCVCVWMGGCGCACVRVPVFVCTHGCARMRAGQAPHITPYAGVPFICSVQLVWPAPVYKRGGKAAGGSKAEKDVYMSILVSKQQRNVHLHCRVVLGAWMSRCWYQSGSCAGTWHLGH